MRLGELTEYEYHRKVRGHPNVLTVRDGFTDGKHAFIVYDLCTGGTMVEALDQNYYRRHPELISRIMLQLIDAVSYCHSLGVAHCDIKLDNLLLSPDKRTVYLSDFGLARCGGVRLGFHGGSYSYVSPGSLSSLLNGPCADLDLPCRSFGRLWRHTGLRHFQE